MLGVTVNTAAVIAGGLIGSLLKKGLPASFSDIIMKAVGLVTIYIGIRGVVEGENALILVLSMMAGTVIGQLLRLDEGLNRLGGKITAKFKSADGSHSMAEGMVSGTLLFCVGAMAVVGSLKAGISGDNSTLYTKSLIDFIAAIMMASTLGWGVSCSAVFVFIYQGLIVLLSGVIAPYLGSSVVAEMTAVGSLLLIAIGLNVLGLTKIRVMNMVPAIFIPIALCRFM